MNDSSFYFGRWQASLGRLGLVVALLMPFCARAEHADRDKPLNIEADNMTYDDLKQISIFTGHVVATKGSIIIKADRVEVRQDPQGYQYAVGTSTGKHLSYFKQKRDVADEYIEGRAANIDYNGQQDLTTLTTNATVRRLQGAATLLDEIHGNQITYDGQNDFYTAKAGQTAGQPNSRVRAMLSSPSSPRTPASSAQGDKSQ